MTRVTNETRGTVLGENVRELTTWGETAQGLLGAREAFAVSIKTRWGIHTIGMRFPIDVVVCEINVREVSLPKEERLPEGGETWIVRAVRGNMSPHRFFFWNPRWRNVLELPMGTIALTRTVAGDRLKISGNV